MTADDLLPAPPPFPPAPPCARARRRPWWLLLALDTVLARSYFGYHWLGDTIAGAVVGAGSSVVVEQLLRRLGWEAGWKDLRVAHIGVMAAAVFAVMKATARWSPTVQYVQR